MKSDRMREVLPDAPAEVIHRDEFVLAATPGDGGGPGARGSMGGR
jgi:hypothetical protein